MVAQVAAQPVLRDTVLLNNPRLHRPNRKRPRAPRKQRRVIIMLHDLLLEALERHMALAIQRRHRNAKEAHQAVRAVLDARRVPVRRPRHALRDAEVRERPPQREHRARDRRQRLDGPCIVRLRAEHAPVRPEEEHECGREQLLQRPPAPEPAARGHGACPPRLCLYVGREGHVAEVGVADLCERVPVKHGVDRLGELRAARLVDAARVDPHPAVAVRRGDLAAPPDLVGWIKEVARAGLGALAAGTEGVNLLECVLLFVPDVREDSVPVGDFFWGDVVVQLCPVGTQQPHLETLGP